MDPVAVFTEFDRDIGAVPDRCDLLVVGAGPAGLALALEAARARPDWVVVLAEAGGFQPPATELRDLLSGSNVGAPYPLEASRLRYFGGTSGHWGGWCRPLDACDFLPAFDGSGPGWPISASEMDEALQAAHRWCEIPQSSYDAYEVLARHPGSMLDLRDSTLFDNSLFRFSPPTRFGSRYHADVAAQENLQCIVRATAIGLAMRGGRCEGVHFSSHAGAKRTIRASQVALAMGGLETTRLLLHAATESQAIAGLRSPALGAYFADHMGLRPGQVMAPAGLQYARFDDESGAVMPVIVPRLEALRDRRWMNMCAMLMPLPAGGEDLPSYAGNAGFGLPGEYWRYSVQMILEPHAQRESRIGLDSERDHFGLPRLRLDWRVAEETINNGVAVFAALASELGRLRVGRGRVLPTDAAAIAASPSQSFHHMGTTRMSDSADEGVVDRDLRVHGSENLFVVSSSVFPRFGFANPTLMIVALACRAASFLATGRRSEA
jgi:choline dehydrogenase-like flavoprotein